MSMVRTLYTVSGLATELAKDRRTISRALASVPPDGKVGAHPGWFMLTALAALGWVGRKLDGERLDPEHERARKDRAIADLHEMKLAILRKDYFAAEHVTRLVTDAFGIVRTGVLSIPSHIAARMPPDVSREAFAIATDQVNHVLTALSEGRVIEAARQEDDAA